MEEINWNWLSKCSNIEHIHINSVMPSIHNDILVKLPKLKGVSFSSEYILEGRKIFYEHDKCLYSIQLPPSVSEINGTHVQLGSMRSFTIPNDVTKLSDCCFRNCLKITEIKNMKKVKEIGKYCFINCPRIDRKKNRQIAITIEDHLNEILSEKESKQLADWTGLECYDIIFDSDLDDWNKDTSILNHRILDCKHVVFLIEDTNGEKFGYYSNTSISSQYSSPIKTDKESFLFNLESHGRLPNSTKFDILDIRNGITLKHKQENELIIVGDITICKENIKELSRCDQYESIFDYHGIKHALCGKLNFVPKRIVVLQMKLNQ